MAISVTGRSFSISAGAVTTSSVTLPAGINAGDVIYIAVMCSGGSNANMFPVPLGLRNYNFAVVGGGSGSTEVTVYYYYKVANGDEGGSVVSWSALSNERIVEAGVVSGLDLRYGPVFALAGSSGAPPYPAPNPPLLTPPWGLAEYLWQAMTVADDGNNAMAGGPVGYDFSAIRNEPGAGIAGVYSGYADKVSVAASENPAAYTKNSGDEWGSVTGAWLGVSGAQSRPVAWHSVESVTGTTNDITIAIPSGTDLRLVVGVSRGAAPTTVTLDPSGAALLLQLVDDGSTTATHSDGSDTTTVWELSAANMPAAGSYTLRVEFAVATQRSVNTLVLQGIDLGAVESVTVTSNDAAMASFSVPTVAPSCTLLTYASRTSVIGTTTIPFDQHDLDGYPMMEYGIYYPNANPARGAVPMVRAGLSPGSHTLELDSQGTSAVCAITVVFREADSEDPIWAGTDF